MRDRTRRLARGLIAAVFALVLLFFGLVVLFRFVNPYTPLMARHALSGPMTRLPLKLSQVPGFVPALLIASEDARFCDHGGVDWGALQEVMSDEDGPSRGASTLAMQVARNVFLWQGSPAFLRKGLEIPIALVLNLAWPKRRLIEVYLNIAEWGPNGEFGLEAGARAAFRKGAVALSPQEAALLVAALPNPKRRLPANPSVVMRRKAGILLSRAPGADISCLR
jgi:monofunctional biosynthetic peptidoglycan transglycosylase